MNLGSRRKLKIKPIEIKTNRLDFIRIPVPSPSKVIRSKKDRQRDRKRELEDDCD